MTILCADSLVNVLDLIADGATVAEATTAIGGAPKSKIIFAWLADSQAAGEFDPPPDPESKWCITWRDKIEWFHIAYREAVADGREIRKVRRSPLRAELEARLAAKRVQPKPAVVSREPWPPVYDATGYVKPAPVYDHVRQEPINLDPPAPPRPSYAYRRPPPLDAVNTRQGPPEEGRFSISRHVVSRAERKAGKPEVTEQGIKWN